MVIEVRVVQFWSEIILVISNQSHAARSFDFEITRPYHLRPNCTPLSSITIINGYINPLRYPHVILFEKKQVPAGHGIQLPSRAA